MYSVSRATLGDTWETGSPTGPFPWLLCHRWQELGNRENNENRSNNDEDKNNKKKNNDNDNDDDDDDDDDNDEMI